MLRLYQNAIFQSLNIDYHLYYHTQKKLIILPPMKVGVYGLGRFGFFWAKELSKTMEVLGYSRNPKRPVPTGVKKTGEQEVLDAEALFLCVSISAMKEVVGRIGDIIPPRTLVFDTCSVKMYPLSVMEGYLPQENPIIGTHPMFGPDSAADGLRGLPLVMSPLRAEEKIIEEWEKIFKRMGLKVIRITPEEHDHTAAYSQGVTHFLGRVLDELNLKPTEIGTMGYKKVLEVVEQTCNDPYQLFLDLQRYNPYTEEMRQKLKDALESTMKKLDWES